MFRTNGVQSSKLAKKKRKQLIIRISLCTVSVFVVVFGLSKLSFWSKISIQTTLLSGNSVIKLSDISTIAETAMEGKHLSLFSKHNVFIYPKDTIKEEVMRTYKRVKEMSLEVDGQALVVSIVEREPTALWCDSEYVWGQSVTCYYMDHEGYIFEEAPDFSEEVYTIFTGNIKESPVGQSYVSKEVFAELGQFIDHLNDIELPVTRVVHKENGEYEFYFKNPTNDEGKVILSTRDPLNASFENLSVFINGYKEKNGGELKPVEYIDLRFGNNIVYKFK